MIRGETITTTITGFPVPLGEIKNLYVVFSSASRVLVEKTLEDCTRDLDAGTVSFKLSQEESLTLKTGNIKRSVLVVTNDGSRFESLPSPFQVEETVKDEVIS